MNRIPQGKDIKATYENFIARCPSCGRENIFNRASDLKGFDPIDYLEVNCLFADCARPFFLNGDVINPAYEMMIWDCYELLERKHYAYCILNLAQAFEVFFSQYIRVELCYRPFSLDSDRDIRQLNDLTRLLYDKVKKWSFEPMRNLFFSLVLQPPRPASLREAEGIVRALPDKLDSPSDDDITHATHFTGGRIPELLLRLKSCKVGELRNLVVHKSAHRPTLNEVNDAIKETRGDSILARSASQGSE